MTANKDPICSNDYFRFFKLIGTIIPELKRALFPYFLDVR